MLNRIAALEAIVATLVSVDEAGAMWQQIEAEFDGKLEAAIVRIGSAFAGSA